MLCSSIDEFINELINHEPRIKYLLKNWSCINCTPWPQNFSWSFFMRIFFSWDKPTVWKKQQRSYLDPSEPPPLKSSYITALSYWAVWGGPLIGLPLCRETPASRTSNVRFSSLENLEFFDGPGLPNHASNYGRKYLLCTDIFFYRKPNFNFK